MANLTVEYTSNKVLKTLELNGHFFHVEIERTELGSRCKCCFEELFEQILPGLMESDAVYEAIQVIDNDGDSCDIMYALKTLEDYIADLDFE